MVLSLFVGFTSLLYALKQASGQWNQKFIKSLLRYGFIQSQFGYSLFTKSTSNGKFVALLIYVDDIVGSTLVRLVAEVKDY